MGKIYVDEQSWELLLTWAENNKWRVLNALPFYKNTTLYLKEYPEYDAHFQAKKYGYKFRIREDKRQFVVGKIIIDENSENDVYIHFDLCEEVNERLDKKMWEILSLKIQVFTNMFLAANAFLWYGNLSDNKNLIAYGRNLEDDKIIVFRPYKEQLYAIPVGHHRSPDGVFEVRGHFRVYKSGKVVWIDSYLKGVNKECKD